MNRLLPHAVLLITLTVAGPLVAANAQATSQDSGSKRVRVNRQGFDLDPKSAQGGGAQLGAGSRGGAPAKIALYAPNLGLAYSLTPLFQWAAESGPVTFHLYDPDDNEVYETEVTGQSGFAYPPDAPALKPGDTYRWTVQGKAVGMLEPPPSAHFKVVSGAERQQLDQDLKKMTTDGKPVRLQRAQFFADNGIWYDAVAAYTSLIADYPNDAKLYQSRAEIYKALPQTKELAAADMAKAKSGQ